MAREKLVLLDIEENPLPGLSPEPEPNDDWERVGRELGIDDPDNDDPETKHLPGRHNQRNHARRGKGSLSAAGFEVVRRKPIGWLGDHIGKSFDGSAYSTIAVDMDKHARTADAYERLPFKDPKAVPAFEAFRDEINEQFNLLTETLGVEVETTETDPYANVGEMIEDLRKNRRIKVLKTSATGSHPFLSDEENDRFRAVHDAFGHAGTGRGFDRHGEEAAYQAHASMFSKEARRALATETRGQNSVLIMRGEFPPQKVALLPEELTKDEARRPPAEIPDATADDDNLYDLGGIHHVTGGRWPRQDEVETKHGDKGTPGYRLLHPGTGTPLWKTKKPEWDPDAGWEVNHRRDKEWTREVRRALSRGDLKINEAEKLGYFSSGHDHRESVRRDGRPAGGWQPLPERLFHVTTAASRVRAEGLKSREDLNQASGLGLGGGEDDTISFTTDEDLARTILPTMREMRRVARGEITAQELLDRAAKGDEGSKPFLDNVFHYWHREWKRGDPYPRGIQDLLNGRVRRGSTGVPESQIAERYGPEWEGDPDPERSWEAPAGRVFTSLTRPMTEDERIEETVDLYKTWLTWRQYAGGPEDPMFFSSDTKSLAQLDPDEIQVLRFRPRPGAQGYPVSSMAEWRTVDGSAVELEED